MNSTTATMLGQNGIPTQFQHQTAQMFNPFGQILPTPNFDMNAYANWLAQLYAAHQANITESHGQTTNNRALMPAPPSTPTPATKVSATSPPSSSSSSASSATDLSDR
ncbi:hypothetical protein EDC01DRAFT_630540 [Geopyxis carbonaria]|nr:hypothetical protein EDC01DRAFT_630540 [Geopyxis carbonaria]